MPIDVQHWYKEETGSFPEGEYIYEFTIWRSKGQWVVEISDEEKFNVFRNQGLIEYIKPSDNYIKWLEEKVEEFMRVRVSK